MQGSLRVHAFSSPACVHGVESSDDGSHQSHGSATARNGDEPCKNKFDETRATKFLQLSKLRRRISQALRSLPSRGAKVDEAAADKDGGDHDYDDEKSDVGTFVSAKSSELRYFFTDDDDSELLPSFRLIPPPPIFPTGSLGRPPSPASPVKIVQKLPFGYVIGRQHGAAPSLGPTLARSIKKVVPTMAALHLWSRSQKVRKKVVRALKGTFRRGSRRGGAGAGDGCADGEDVFWKKDVRGLRCRRVEDDDDDEPY